MHWAIAGAVLYVIIGFGFMIFVLSAQKTIGKEEDMTTAGLGAAVWPILVVAWGFDRMFSKP